MRVEFQWTRQGADQGRLRVAQCEGQRIPGEQSMTSGIGNGVVQGLTSEAHRACLAAGTGQSLRPPNGSFVYLDAGRWLNGHQDFGVVWGNQAVLCSYRAAGTTPAAGGGNLLEQLLRQPGVSEVDREFIRNARRPDWNKITVIVPDCHIPPSVPRSVPRPPESERWNNLTFGGPFDDPRAWDRSVGHDIFGSRASTDALASFLGLLCATPFAGQVHLVQAGDLYELWAGFDRWFQARPSGPPGVDMRSDAAIRACADQIALIHDYYDGVFTAFDRAAATLGSVKFLHGNHDNYLWNSGVVAAANREIEERAGRTSGSIFGNRAFPRSRCFPREASGMFVSNGMVVEHGQRIDTSNSDGNETGHSATQQGVGGGRMAAFAKEFDCVRRESFVFGAAALWVTRNMDFSVYVMGHTHEPIVKNVEVVHTVGEMRVYPSLSPYGMAAPVWVTTEGGGS
jgi:hypothetical protein